MTILCEVLVMLVFLTIIRWLGLIIRFSGLPLMSIFPSLGSKHARYTVATVFLSHVSCLWSLCDVSSLDDPITYICTILIVG